MAIEHRQDSVKEAASSRQRAADISAAAGLAFVVLAESGQYNG
jgi:hypothetical protein